MSTTLLNNVDLWTSAVRHKSTAGRGSNRKLELAGINKLRELILELAVRGKLVPQNPDDEPASELLKRIEAEKAQLIKDGKLKKQKPLPSVTDEEKPFELPQGWEWAYLPNVTRYEPGKTPSTKDSSYWSENKGYPWVSIADLNDGKSVCTTNKYISESAVQKVFKKPASPKGTILMSFKLTVGKISLLETDAFHNEAILSIYPYSGVSKEFLFKILPKRALSGNTKGAIMGQTLNSDSLAKIVIPLPPLTEQQRIVAKVDELMALCDQLEQQSEHQLDAHQQLTETLLAALLTPAAGALTNATSAQELSDNWQRLAQHFDLLFSGPMGAWAIDRLKDTILQLAVMGKLVPQNPDDEPAAELLKRIDAEKARLVKEGKIKKQKPLPPVNDDEKPFELPQGWEYERLANLTDIQSGIAKGKKFDRQETVTFPYLRVANVQRGFLILDEMKEIEILKSDVEKYAVIERDLLITEGGDWDKVGRTAIWPRYDGIMLHQNHVFKARLILADQSEIWMERYLNSSFAREYFAGSSKQTTNLASINKTQLSNTVVPIPPLAEQQRIVAKVDELFALCDQLKERLQHASETQLNLTDAIVEKALS